MKNIEWAWIGLILFCCVNFGKAENEFFLIFRKNITQDTFDNPHKIDPLLDNENVTLRTINLNSKNFDFAKLLVIGLNQKQINNIEHRHFDIFLDYFEDTRIGFDLDGHHEYVAKLGEMDSKVNSENRRSINAQNFESCEIQYGASFNLARLSSGNNTLAGFDTGEYWYPTTSSVPVVKMYILDTGINKDHQDFGGRVVKQKDYTGEGIGDHNGHGTHVAGIATATSYGVSKHAQIYDYKILGMDGAGSLQGIFRAFSDIYDEFLLDEKPPTVINLSLGLTFNEDANTWVNFLVTQGIHVVVAAGNSGDNACLYSPASASQAITVGSTTVTDYRSHFSNYGSCVDIFAPGSRITSLSHEIGLSGQNNQLVILYGTSQACPHVAGIAGLILEQNPNLTPAEVKQIITNTAVQDIILDAKEGSPNLLAQVLCSSNLAQFTDSNDDNEVGDRNTNNNNNSATNLVSENWCITKQMVFTLSLFYLLF